MAIPTQELTTFTAGDTVTWTRSLSDYPASAGWVLSYRLVNATESIDIPTAASGNDHLVSLAATATANWMAGQYTWAAYVTNGPERHTVCTGTLEIKPNLATMASYDGRSSARQILDGLTSAYQTYVTNKQGHIAEYQIAGRTMKFRSAAEILTQIQHWQRQVHKEKQAERIARGLGSGSKVYVRF